MSRAAYDDPDRFYPGGAFPFRKPVPREPLTVATVEARVLAIESAKGDSEIAHGMEDGLYIEVLAAIEAGDPDPAGLARAALKAENIEFGRWHA